jgi:tRNA A-37 threonylcarbamoyl transferase component Bud32
MSKDNKYRDKDEKEAKSTSSRTYARRHLQTPPPANTAASHNTTQISPAQDALPEAISSDETSERRGVSSRSPQDNFKANYSMNDPKYRDLIPTEVEAGNQQNFMQHIPGVIMDPRTDLEKAKSLRPFQTTSTANTSANSTSGATGSGSAAHRHAFSAAEKLSPNSAAPSPNSNATGSPPVSSSPHANSGGSDPSNQAMPTAGAPASSPTTGTSAPTTTNQTTPPSFVCPPALRERGYEITEEIGGGAFSRVYRARYRQLADKEIAVKIIALDKVPEVWRDKCLRQELRIVRKLQHPHIVKVWDIIKTRRNVFIFMDLAENNSVLHYMQGQNKPLLEHVARIWFTQTTGAISYMHSKGIAHRDLKNENILLDRDHNAKLTDFGFACYALDKDTKSVL